jgi:DNA repair protein RadC
MEVHQLEMSSLFKVSELELVYRKQPEPLNSYQISCSISAYDAFKQTWDENKLGFIEEFKILLLDNRNYCLGISEISKGGLDSCPVDARVVFSTALQSKTTRIILAHNHPSGNLKPSQADLDLTSRLIEIGKILCIKINDHLIVTPNSYYSFADNGLMHD